MFKRVLALSFTAVLVSGSAFAAGPDSTDASQLQDAVTVAQDALAALKGRFEGRPGYHARGESVVVELGDHANAYDKEILEKQLPRIEDYLVNASLKFGDAAQLLPSNEGTTIFYQGCADTLRAQRQVDVVLSKVKRSKNFKTADFDFIQSDIQQALADSKCR
ncbi:hypothetical protein [Oligoflexus tunisiensis]|uniref:hypothetical protein n=1 Tax=Oligoflexus tunisiensis TaxID=708132 RepID=UPI00114C8FF9|nr:hypothetical protein [Oligoflexus tunisiensis]